MKSVLDEFIIELGPTKVVKILFKKINELETLLNN